MDSHSLWPPAIYQRREGGGPAVVAALGGSGGAQCQDARGPVAATQSLMSDETCALGKIYLVCDICTSTGKVTSVKFGADAKYIAVGSMDRNLRILGLQSCLPASRNETLFC